MVRMEKELTGKIHSVELAQVRTETAMVNLNTDFRNFREMVKDMPSKSQVGWVMGIVAALIIAVVGSAYAVLTSIPK